MFKIKCQAISVSAVCGFINVAQQKYESGAVFSLFDKDVLAWRLSLKLGNVACIPTIPFVRVLQLNAQCHLEVALSS